MVKVAINGFGRIGEQFLLACIEKRVKWDFVINDPSGAEVAHYALTHDSIQPRPKNKISFDSKNLIIDGKRIRVYSELNPEKLPWKDEKVDLVVDCSGKFTDRESAIKHLTAGAKKVLISAPAKNPDATIVLGVNEKTLKPSHKIISAGSCTTNCVAPMVKVLHDRYGIKNAFFLTSHAYTSTQKLIDANDKKDALRGRAAAFNIVPSTSGASQSVIECIPSLKGKLEGFALRVPVADGSIATLITRLNKKVSLDEINSLFKKASASSMKGIIEYSREPLVSTDIIHNPSSCIFEEPLTEVINDSVSISGWYDNEWGYSNRLADVAKLILGK